VCRGSTPGRRCDAGVADAPARAGQKKAKWLGTLAALKICMSQRAHFWIRLVAFAVIVAVASLPRGNHAPEGADGSETAQVAHK
jgi:hypothetical protein